MNHLPLTSRDKLSLFSSLSTMLGAGIPILEAVDSLLEEAKGNQKKVLVVLKEELNEGKTIAEALGNFPNAFDKVSLSLIKASEEAGTLEQVLKDITKNVRKEIEFTDKVRSALLYPVLVFIVFLLVLIVILVFVIPRVAVVFRRLNVTLPLPTKILISLSDLLTSYYLVIIIGTLVLTIFSIWFYKKHRQLFLNLLYSLPLLSKLAREIDLTQFTRSMSLLLSSGIPITEALALAEQVVVKKEILTVVEESKRMVQGGKEFSAVLKDHKKVIPPIMIRITEAGEKSGTLEKSMQELTEDFEIAVLNNLKSLTTMLEPIMLVVVGILVGGMMLSIIAPIYQLIGNIQAR